LLRVADGQNLDPRIWRFDSGIKFMAMMRKLGDSRWNLENMKVTVEL